MSKKYSFDFANADLGHTVVLGQSHSGKSAMGVMSLMEAVKAGHPGAIASVAAAAGILISGMEMDGVDKTGQQKFKFQEWLLRHLNPN